VSNHAKLVLWPVAPLAAESAVVALGEAIAAADLAFAMRLELHRD
jgi:hypothetical protein